MLIDAKEGDEVILLRLPGIRLAAEQCRALIASLWSHSADAPGLEGRFHVCHGADVEETYIYVADSRPSQASNGRQLSDRGIATFLDGLNQAYANADISVLTVTRAIAGASYGRVAGWHYVVETDVLPEAESDFNAWYDQEHMPGLAAVPGTVRALRLLNKTGAPRYHALYLLETRKTFGSEPWLKVRATDWSSRVRPNFTNTKRTMFVIEGAL
ncbi:DUF4286 family protein [Bordetella sp. 15P40C-2]|uniref:DUF4286 family protein n=1 Tax=Bordetella sp. 15P40C-2 TaxID=2572246 RepID=UPI001F1F26CE|nr:DUF4286 family protein [Bordetella sp. 15P40C-2]